MTNQPMKTVGTKPKDYTVLEVMIALFLLIASLYCMRLAAALPLTLRSFEAMASATKTGLIIYIIAAVASAVVLIWNFSKAAFRICKHTLAISILGIITCLIFRRFFIDRMPLLYFMHCAFYCLYIIFMLYRTEFFLVSLMTSLSGWAFYSFCGGISFNLRTVLYAALVVVVCVLSVIVAWNASGAKGILKIFGKKYKLFPTKFQPMLILLTAALWLLCLIVSLFAGSMFSYYCMFAAIAFELIAAVYYTFQLK